jgi:hypothetical protein
MSESVRRRFPLELEPNIRKDEIVIKGFLREQFEESFARYLPLNRRLPLHPLLPLVEHKIALRTTRTT